MAETLELDLERDVLGPLPEILRFSRTVEQPEGPTDLAGEFARLARSQAASRHDFRAASLGSVRSVDADSPPARIDKINRFYQKLADLHIGGCEILLEIAAKLQGKGIPVEGVDELREAIADCRRWKEDLPDELFLRCGPVQRRLAAAIEEGLRNPPAASNWQELFDE
jgi:hypothetical protein